MTEHTIQLTTLTYGGETLGRLPDGRAVFVPYGLPGETVRLHLVAEKRGHARAELLEVLTPAPSRLAPHCPHHFVPGAPPDACCGGCHYQHLPYPDQLAAKQAILRDQLIRLAGLADPLVRPTVPSPTPWNYRNHVQFHLTPTARLGFQAAHSHHIVQISECHLPELALNALWPQLDLEPLPGLARLSLRLGADDDAMLVFESDDPQPLAVTVEDLPLSVVQVGPRGALVLAGSDHLVMEVRGRPFRVSAASFFQVNTLQAAALVEALLARLPLAPAAAILDLYCGVGLFSAFIAPHVGRLLGVESAPSASDDFAANLDEFDNVEFYEAPAELALPALAEAQPALRPAAVVLDPPRAGLAPAALEALLRLDAPLLAYVSCDPATLARDARRLVAAGYRLEQATPFDLFPQTYHIESLSFWVKN
jgi:23S rRNA (uracil1939-C5)-methyltransferase